MSAPNAPRDALPSLDTALDARIRAIVDERLRAIDLRPPREYSASNLPPDIKSRNRFNVLARGCPGARKAGRTWLVPIDAWHSYRAAKESPDVSATVATMLQAMQ